MGNKTFIYILLDNKNNIRYVGKSDNPNKRLKKHINESKKNKTHKEKWIQSLLNNNSTPELLVIDEVNINEWSFWETYWISQFKAWGFKLTNSTIGGEGGSGYKHTDEAKEKMRQNRLGKTTSEETKQKQSIATKEYAKNNPNFNKVFDRKITLDKEKLYDLYITQNLSIPKISEILNISEKVIFTNLKEFKIEKDRSLWTKQCGDNHRKVVLQYDKSGNFIKEWESVDSAAKELGFNRANLAATCRGVNKTCMGYIWKYKDNI